VELALALALWKLALSGNWHWHFLLKINISLANQVLNEATAALLYQSSLGLGREELLKFKALKLVVRIGSGVHNLDVQAATELGEHFCGSI
jgi:phosphoglycerate dehydrogenase-like enzyme